MEEPFLPQNLLREISTKQCSKETPTKKYLRKKSTPRKKNLCQTIFEDQIRPKYIYIYMSEEKFATKQSVKGDSQPNKLWIEIFSKQISKEISNKSIWKNMPTKTSLKRNLSEKISEEKTLPRNKFIEQFLYQK